MVYGSIIPFLLKITFSGIFDVVSERMLKMFSQTRGRLLFFSTMERLLFQASLHIARLPSPKLNLQTVNFEPWYPRVGLGVGGE